jgi:hypothetical protein
MRYEAFEGSAHVPVWLIEVPAGIRDDAKKKMVEKITTALDETWYMGQFDLAHHPPV